MPLIPIILVCVYYLNYRCLNKFLKVLSVVLLMYYPVHKYRVSNFDYGFQKATESLSDINKLNLIKTNADSINKIVELYNYDKTLDKQGEEMLFIGKPKYLYDYILENGKGYSLQEFHTPDENTLIERISPILNNYSAVCLLMDYHQIEENYENFVIWLKQNGYYSSKTGKEYIILHKNNDNDSNTDVTDNCYCASLL